MNAGHAGCGGVMKGQLVLEFVVAAIILFGVILYVMGNVMASVDSRNAGSAQNTLMTRAFMISDAVFRGSGVWTGETPVMIGVSDDWPVLNSTKMQYLESYCSTDYQDLKYRLGLGPDNGVAMLVNETGMGEIMRCGVPETGARYAKVTRFGITESNNVARIDVWVW